MKKTHIPSDIGNGNCNPQNAMLFDPYQHTEKRSNFQERVTIALKLCSTCPVKKECEQTAEINEFEGVAAGKYYGPLHHNIQSLIPHHIRRRTPPKENLVAWVDVTGDQTPYDTVMRELGTTAYRHTSLSMAKTWISYIQKQLPTHITVTPAAMTGATPHDITTLRRIISTSISTLFDTSIHHHR